MKTKLPLLICLLLLSTCAWAQDTSKVKTPPPKMYSIETTDGASIVGTLVSEDAQQIVLQTKSMGNVTIAKNKIKSMKEIDETAFVKGEYWFENPNATRYVIGPSAYNLRKGEGYYQNLYLFGQSFNVGVTDNISVGGGFEIASLIFAAEPPQVIFLTPKIGFNVKPKLKLGAGVLYVNVNGFSSGYNNHYGIAYGLATAGTMNNNVTLGVGWGFHSYKRRDYLTNTYTTESGFADRPIITVSGMTRLAKRFALTTENWFYPATRELWNSSTNTYTVTYTYDFFISYGARFMGERIAVDFGFLNNPDIASEIVIGIPYIDFVVKFGGNKKKK